MTGRITTIACSTLLFVACGGIPDYAGPQPTTWDRQPYTHMPDADRLGVESLVIAPFTPKVETEIFGTYERDVPDAIDSAVAAASLPLHYSITLATGYPGLVPPEILIPVITLPWALGGAAVGKMRTELQEFRDAMTDSLASDPRSQLSNAVLTDDLYSEMRRNPNTDVNVIGETVRLPAGTDHVLLARYSGIEIEVEGDMAEIEISAFATLRRLLWLLG